MMRERKNQTIRELVIAYIQFADPAMTGEEIQAELRLDYPHLDQDILERVQRVASAALDAMANEFY